MSTELIVQFQDDIDTVLKSANVEKIYDVDLVQIYINFLCMLLNHVYVSVVTKHLIKQVFFPVLLEKSHFYLVVFNLKTPKIEIIDNSKNGSEADMKERYGRSLKKLV